jgi:hypothetical protein
MVVWQAPLWGGAGGLLVELTDFYRDLRQGQLRWVRLDVSRQAYAMGVVVRMVIGALPAAALYTTLDNPAYLLAVGVGADAIIRELMKRVQLVSMFIQPNPAGVAPVVPPGVTDSRKAPTTIALDQAASLDGNDVIDADSPAPTSDAAGGPSEQ